MRRHFSIVALAGLLVHSANAYVHLTVNGTQARRSDFANIAFLLNNAAVAGLVNAQGQPFITSDSDPVGAIRAALGTWNAVSTSAARFAPLGTTSAGNAIDGRNVFVFADSPDIRAFLGDAVAKTVFSLSADGRILETDILFNPAKTFSTTQADGTYDIQSVATHELGHALGADHTGILGAAMYQNTFPGQINQRRLSPDDIAFVSSTYPPSGGNGYGTVSGRLTATAGGPLRGGFITLADPATGVVIDTLTSPADGTYSVQTPPGNYEIYAEPLTGEVKAANLLSMPMVDLAFQPTFYGGVNQPAVVAVDPGGVAAVDLAAPPGPSPIQVQFTAVLPVGQGGSFMLLPGPKIVASGQSVDLLLFGSAIDGSLTDANVRIVGPAAVRPGSVHADSATVNGAPVVRLTLDIPARLDMAVASLVIVKGADTGVFSGGLILTPPKPVFTAASTVNGGSFLGTGVAPGEIVTIFGTNIGPAAGLMNGGFDENGALPTTLGGVSVSFGGVLAPLFYAGPAQINLQVPYEVANAPATSVTVQVSGAESDRVIVPVVPAAPAAFQIPGTNRAIVINQDGSLNSPQAPAPPGSVITIYATGGGIVSPPVATGKPAGASPLSAAGSAAVTIGGLASNVLFAGMSPGFVGLMQINATIPASAPSGPAIPLLLAIGGAVSPPDVTIAIF